MLTYPPLDQRPRTELYSLIQRAVRGAVGDGIIPEADGQLILNYAQQESRIRLITLASMLIEDRNYLIEELL